MTFDHGTGKRTNGNHEFKKKKISGAGSASEEGCLRGLRPLQPLLCLQHVQLCHYATCQGSSYTKNEYIRCDQKVR